MDFQCRYYAALGFVSASVSYRSIDFEDTTTVFDLIADCRDAAAFLLQSFPGKRLILLGDSAGAHLALCLALNACPGIAGVIAANPVVDCTREPWHATAPSPEERRAASPLYSVHKIPSKILCLNGDADTVTDCRLTESFCLRMQDAGNCCDFIPVPGAPHAFLLSGYRSTPEEVMKYMKLIDRWLKRNILHSPGDYSSLSITTPT